VWIVAIDSIDDCDRNFLNWEALQKARFYIFSSRAISETKAKKGVYKSLIYVLKKHPVFIQLSIRN
jgi:hypothetical protein